ncbi:CND2 protein, partial [Rhinopomastus cyanomelas]|nr:CND2 protein [Rhinopomastus cyanomelas]
GQAPSPAARALGTGAPVLTQCTRNDDEQERRQRRRSKVTDLALGGTNSPLRLASPRVRQVPTAPLQWTNSQISEHYSTCIKLSSENKITTKNVFGLHLIDYMNEVLQQKNTEVAGFKVAAGTLDASVKIYSVRVDAVHTDTYKVLGGLGKSKDKEPAPAGGGDSPDQEANPVPEIVRKVQAKRKHTFRTIEQSLGNINAPEGGRRCAADPAFQRTMASFDECSAAGVFLSRLRTRSGGGELAFDFQIIPLPSSEAAALPSAGAVNTMDFKSLLAPCVERRPICSSLAGFQFSAWDAESDESVLALLDKYRGGDQAFDVGAEAGSSEDDCGPSPAGSDLAPDSPGSPAAVEEIGTFRDHLGCFTTSHQSQRTGSNPFGDGDISTMSLHLSMKPGDYSYFSPRILSMWAGPNHWHFRPAHKDASGKEPRRRNTRKVFEINFDEDIDFRAHFRKGRAALTLSKSTGGGQSTKSTTLPTDYSYEPSNIVQLFLKPSVTYCRTAAPQSLLDHDDHLGGYDYNNPNDTSNFCPAPQAADSDDDDSPLPLTGPAGGVDPTWQHGLGDPELSRADATACGEMLLLAEPQKVQKVVVQFAKAAKRMDMRRLKETMWRLLAGGAAAEVEDAVEEASVVAEEKVFSSIMKELHHTLPPAMATNLSVPLALACLLHLANEKNLKLENVEDLSNILVKQ